MNLTGFGKKCPMEAHKLKNIDDLIEALKTDDRLELINGEIVRRPMARFEHGQVQGNLREELGALRRKGNHSGWWFATEVSVKYSEHQVPCHDIVGWRKERVQQKPSGVVEFITLFLKILIRHKHQELAG